MDRRAPTMLQLGTVTVYTLPPLRRDRRVADLAERERRAWEVMLLLRPFAISKPIRW